MVINIPFLVEYLSDRTCYYTEQEASDKHQNVPEVENTQNIRRALPHDTA